MGECSIRGLLLENEDLAIYVLMKKMDEIYIGEIHAFAGPYTEILKGGSG